MGKRKKSPAAAPEEPLALDESETDAVPGGLKIRLPARQKQEVGNVKAAVREEEEEEPLPGMDSFLEYDWGIESTPTKPPRKKHASRSRRSSDSESVEIIEPQSPTIVSQAKANRIPTPSIPQSLPVSRKAHGKAKRKDTPSSSEESDEPGPAAVTLPAVTLPKPHTALPKRHTALAPGKGKARKADSSSDEDSDDSSTVPVARARRDFEAFVEIPKTIPPSQKNRKGTQKPEFRKYGPVVVSRGTDWKGFLALVATAIDLNSPKYLHLASLEWKFLTPTSSPLLPLTSEAAYRSLNRRVQEKKKAYEIMLKMKEPTRSAAENPWGNLGPDEDVFMEQDASESLMDKGTIDETIKEHRDTLLELYAAGKCVDHPKIPCFHHGPSDLHWDLNPQRLLAWAGQIANARASTVAPEIPSAAFTVANAIKRVSVTADSATPPAAQAPPAYPPATPYTHPAGAAPSTPGGYAPPPFYSPFPPMWNPPAHPGGYGYFGHSWETPGRNDMGPSRHRFEDGRGSSPPRSGAGRSRRHVEDVRGSSPPADAPALSIVDANRKYKESLRRG